MMHEGKSIKEGLTEQGKIHVPEAAEQIHVAEATDLLTECFIPFAQLRCS